MRSYHAFFCLNGLRFLIKMLHHLSTLFFLFLILFKPSYSLFTPLQTSNLHDYLKLSFIFLVNPFYEQFKCKSLKKYLFQYLWFLFQNFLWLYGLFHINVHSNLANVIIIWYYLNFPLTLKYYFLISIKNCQFNWKSCQLIFLNLRKFDLARIYAEFVSLIYTKKTCHQI